MSFVSDNIDTLSEIAKCISTQFGPECEVVLHDLTLPYDHTIVAIYNGHITGRKVGGSGTNTGLEILQGSVQPTDQYNYINTTENGRTLRSSSKYFRDHTGKIVGSLCINYDITNLLQGQATISHLTSSEGDSHIKEVFVDNIDDLLDQMMKEAVANTGKALDELTKEDMVSIVHALNSKGLFLIKKSVERVAEFLGISRFSVYNYLNKEPE